MMDGGCVSAHNFDLVYLMSNMKKIFIGIGVITALVLVGGGFFVYQETKSQKGAIKTLFVGKDIAPIDDSDLRLSKVVVDDSDNAYFDLMKVDKAIYWPKEKDKTISDMIAGKIWDARLAQELISKNIEAFGYFVDASLKPKYQDPATADPANTGPNTILPPLNTWRHMSRLSAVRSLSLSKQGKDKEAMTEALHSVDIGQKMQNSQEGLIEYLVASAMKSVGLNATQKILVTSKFKTSELKEYIQDLDQYYKNEEGLTNAFKSEHYVMFPIIDLMTSAIIYKNKEAIDMLNKLAVAENITFDAKLMDSYHFEPNKTKLLISDSYRNLISDTNKPCWNMQGLSVKKSEIASSTELYATENALGIIISGDITSLSSAITKKCREDALVGATKTLFAIKAFKNDTKKYPTTLDGLVPKYLNVVPIDPFDGKQFKYSAEKKIVYSIGEDKQDSGGIMSDDTAKTPDPDIVFPIRF